jgi:hypothetical protein
VAENKEVNALKQIIGLKHDMKYTSLDQLRYGRLMILSDADLDGEIVVGLNVRVRLQSVQSKMAHSKGGLSQARLSASGGSRTFLRWTLEIRASGFPSVSHW